MRPKILIPVGYGLNCEDETVYTWKAVGAEPTKIHINDLFENPQILSDYHVLDLIGGFSDGDHIAAGKVHANRLRYRLGEHLKKFIEEGKLIIGICNGFQHLVKAGILPGFDGDYSTQRLTLTYNDSGKFEDRWVHLKVNKESRCVFTRELNELYLPVRHGEGKVRIRDQAILERLKEGNQIVLQYIHPETGEVTMVYPYNPNGSDEAIAGICDPTGRVFGMMPHREAFWSPYNHPNWTRLKIHRRDKPVIEEGNGVQMFRNAVEYVMENF
jgi:phosphoribosylformylglycinamidine synthase